MVGRANGWQIESGYAAVVTGLKFERVCGGEA